MSTDRPTTASEVALHLAQPAATDPPMYLATAARLGWDAFADWINHHIPQHSAEPKDGQR